MWRIGAALSVGTLIVLAVSQGQATGAGSTKQIKSGPAVQISLKQQLNQGLKSRRPVEFAFIDLVVAKVEAGELPIDLVNVVFDWARYQPDHPFQRFQFGITRLAKRRGINLSI